MIVLANGCFDVLHRGHVDHLIQARSFGGYLIVSLTEDAHVNKGPLRPLNTWEDRATVLRALRCVDEVIPTKSAVDAIRQVKPNIFVKGIDYNSGNCFTEDIYSICNEMRIKIVYTDTPKRSFSDVLTRLGVT